METELLWTISVLYVLHNQLGRIGIARIRTVDRRIGVNISNILWLSNSLSQSTNIVKTH